MELRFRLGFKALKMAVVCRGGCKQGSGRTVLELQGASFLQLLQKQVQPLFLRANHGYVVHGRRATGLEVEADC